MANTTPLLDPPPWWRFALRAGRLELRLKDPESFCQNQLRYGHEGFQILGPGNTTWSPPIGEPWQAWLCPFGMNPSDFGCVPRIFRSACLGRQLPRLEQQHSKPTKAHHPLPAILSQELTDLGFTRSNDHQELWGSGPTEGLMVDKEAGVWTLVPDHRRGSVLVSVTAAAPQGVSQMVLPLVADLGRKWASLCQSSEEPCLRT